MPLLHEANSWAADWSSSPRLGSLKGALVFSVEVAEHPDFTAASRSARGLRRGCVRAMNTAHLIDGKSAWTDVSDPQIRSRLPGPHRRHGHYSGEDRMAPLSCVHQVSGGVSPSAPASLVPSPVRNTNVPWSTV